MPKLEEDFKMSNVKEKSQLPKVEARFLIPDVGVAYELPTVR